MEETTEEKRLAVLAYCEQLCPNYDDKHHLSGGIYLQALSHGWALYEKRANSEYAKCFEPIWNYITPSDTTVQIFYALLGLEASDAVAAERAKVAELEKQNKKLQWLLDGEILTGEQRTAMQIIPMMREAAKDELIDKLQAKSAALVEALQSLKLRAWDAFNKIELAAVQKGAVGRIKRPHTESDTVENDSYIREILEAKRTFDAQVDELIESHKKGATT